MSFVRSPLGGDPPWCRRAGGLDDNPMGRLESNVLSLQIDTVSLQCLLGLSACKECSLCPGCWSNRSTSESVLSQIVAKHRHWYRAALQGTQCRLSSCYQKLWGLVLVLDNLPAFLLSKGQLVGSSPWEFSGSSDTGDSNCEILQGSDKVRDILRRDSDAVTHAKGIPTDDVEVEEAQAPEVRGRPEWARRRGSGRANERTGSKSKVQGSGQRSSLEQIHWSGEQWRSFHSDLDRQKSRRGCGRGHPPWAVCSPNPFTLRIKVRVEVMYA